MALIPSYQNCNYGYRRDRNYNLQYHSIIETVNLNIGPLGHTHPKSVSFSYLLLFFSIYTISHLLAAKIVISELMQSLLGYGFLGMGSVIAFLLRKRIKSSWNLQYKNLEIFCTNRIINIICSVRWILSTLVELLINYPSSF